MKPTNICTVSFIFSKQQIHRLGLYFLRAQDFSLNCLNSYEANINLILFTHTYFRRFKSKTKQNKKKKHSTT